MRQAVYLPLHLPGMNDIIREKAAGKMVESKGRQVWVSSYSKKKKKHTHDVALLCVAALEPVKAAFFTFLHRRTSRLENPDNIVGGAHKFVFDGLQKSGIIKNDGWGEVLGFADYWEVSGAPGVLVVLDPDRVLTHEECTREMEIWQMRHSLQRPMRATTNSWS